MLALCYNLSLTDCKPCCAFHSYRCVCGKNNKVADYSPVLTSLARELSLSFLDVGGPTTAFFGQNNKPTPRFLFRTVNIDVPY